MTTVEDVVRLLDASTDDVAIRLRRALRAGSVVAIVPGPGRGTARNLHGTFSVRQATAAAACVPTAGFSLTLTSLKELDPAESVLILHFAGVSDVFSLFLTEATSRILGCIWVGRDDSHNEGAGP
jgi:hypothetical protein